VKDFGKISAFPHDKRGGLQVNRDSQGSQNWTSGVGSKLRNPLETMAKKTKTLNSGDTYHILDTAHTDPVRLKREREKARSLKKSQWWLSLVNQGICHHCGGRFPANKLTMDHLVPLARGGTSAQGNIVPSCKACNSAKGLETPLDDAFRALEEERTIGASAGGRESAWGDDSTQFFYDLTPDRVLEAVENMGLPCTGRCSALNSFENRVYEVELDAAELEGTPGFPASARNTHSIVWRRVVKFYRPGRWTREQILEEHAYIAALNEAEIPAVAPIILEPRDGSPVGTLQQTVDGLWYAIFPKVGGRAPDELDSEQLRRVGRFIGRMHSVGAARTAQRPSSRVRLNPTTYGRANLDFLLDGGFLPPEYESRYQDAVLEICDWLDPKFKELGARGALHLIHGDCHRGNLLWNDQGPFFLDFDDCVVGPAVQDLWLLQPGRSDAAGEDDGSGRRAFDALLSGYQELRPFDHSQLSLVEGLRALRFVHYAAWIARRWEDPAFPLAFPQFGSHRYWGEETEDLERQLRLSQSPSSFQEQETWDEMDGGQDE
jgi:Ser/Thr protein kinase RdoA (MazF antagonist)/5-methylcytosine-specific restriction endonuclease McrA